jgi:predicted pyridoxine 5'-phosphate oxidase superfamily flavin-nucleotide-binding protein
VQVLDPHTLAFPEYRGNGVMASAGNIVENGHVALLFIDFCQDVIGLHVNGRAELVEPPQMRERAPLLAEDPHPGRKPSLWVLVRVEEAYVHCSKHIPLFLQLPKQQHWGTNDHKRKGGDFFHAAVWSSPDQ